MIHPFAELRQEYESLLLRMTVTRPKEVDWTAKKLLRPAGMVRYDRLTTETKIPAVLVAALHERESGADFTTNLAQGDPLTRPSVHVPKGRPPLGAPPNDHFQVSWDYAALDAVRYDHLDDISIPAWTLPYACWKAEAWNGFGPRNHGRYSGYLWAGTNVYDPPSGKGGKYVADGVWSADTVDKQLGVVPVMIRMMEIDPSLEFDASRTGVVTGKLPTPLPTPIGVGGEHNVQWIQRSLNRLGFGPLLVDGNYGRRTREAVRAFQAKQGLLADGLAGPITIPALESEMRRL